MLQGAQGGGPPCDDRFLTRLCGSVWLHGGDQRPLGATRGVVSRPAMAYDLLESRLQQHVTERPLPDGPGNSVRPRVFAG